MPRESELGEMLRGMRVAAGLSQEELRSVRDFAREERPLRGSVADVLR